MRFERGFRFRGVIMRDSVKIAHRGLSGETMGHVWFGRAVWFRVWIALVTNSSEKAFLSRRNARI